MALNYGNGLVGVWCQGVGAMGRPVGVLGEG